jgi:hypothetical protein
VGRRRQLGGITRHDGGLDAREPRGQFFQDQPHECPHQGWSSYFL